MARCNCMDATKTIVNIRRCWPWGHDTFPVFARICSLPRKTLLGVTFREPVPGTKQFEVKAKVQHVQLSSW